MVRPIILPLSHCTAVDLTGGKAMGLARLIAAGFAVPSGFCITTEAYVQALQGIGFQESEEWSKVSALSGQARAQAIADTQTRIKAIETSHLSAQWKPMLHTLDLPQTIRWAVRSSATNEDAQHTSFAGLYCTHLAVAVTDIDTAMKDLWASLWEERVVTYIAQQPTHTIPRMAVILQPMLEAQAAGVAYSIHPVTGRSNHVMINAVPGLAASLVDGTATPDQYIVEVTQEGKSIRLQKRTLVRKPARLIVSSEGLRKEVFDETGATQSSLTDDQALTLAHTAKDIERLFGQPMDIEWVFDPRQLWLVQARPITAIPPSTNLTNDDCEWSRTNFKETLPELPSPLSIAFLEEFMDRYILAHYRRLGCHIPEGVTSVRVLQGRPYLNVTLFHMLVAQLRGDPSLNTEQLGGDPLHTAPPVTPLGGFSFIRAGWLTWAEMKRVERSGPLVFNEMRELATTYQRTRILHLSVDELVAHLVKLGPWLEGRELTFGIAGGVGQCLQLFSQLLPRWIGSDWRQLLNGALQGQGTVISAQQILRLAELTDMARDEPLAMAYFTSASWTPSAFRDALTGTVFLQAFDRYLLDYGHRAVGESDVMSPRLADNPEAILAIIHLQLKSTSVSQNTILSRQHKLKTAALAEIKQRIGWRLDRWAMFLWCYRRLCRFFALREANRHHLMYYSMAIRTILIRLGERLAERGLLQQADDIFFLTIEDRANLLSGNSQDWISIVTARRAERERYARIEVPDTIRDWGSMQEQTVAPRASTENGVFSGMPISIGTVTGPVRVIRAVEDWAHVLPGDILVVPVIDPGLAPLFGLAGGLIAEMGGTLSHGAIIAREYGLPTVTNVEGAMTTFSTGLRVTLNAGAGTIHIEPPASNHHD